MKGNQNANMSREEFNNVQAQQVANTAYNGNELYDKGIVSGKIFVLPEEMREERLEIEVRDGYQFKDENGNVINATKIVLEKKKKEYPKTVDRCRVIVGAMSGHGAFGYQAKLMSSFMSLLICRDAYWQIAGDWRPEFRFGKKKYCIITKDNKVISATVEETNRTLVFPTEEMRDAFYENFKDLIEQCKELL